MSEKLTTDGPMTIGELNLMSAGTHAQMRGTFNKQTTEYQKLYWAIVDKFNAEFKPPISPAPEGYSRRTFVVQKTWMTEEEVTCNVPDGECDSINHFKDYLGRHVANDAANNQLDSQWVQTVVMEDDEQMADWS